MQNVLTAPRTIWQVAAHDKEGVLLWEEESTNIVFDAAINDLLAVYFRDGTKKPNWYIGLVNSPGSFLPSDTMGVHSTWSENINYQSATRPAATFNAPATKSINTLSNRAIFTMTGAGGNILGTFLVSDSVKGGSTGIVYAASPFALGPKSLQATDTLSVAVVVAGV